jgi:hypothetical protein
MAVENGSLRAATPRTAERPISTIAAVEVGDDGVCFEGVAPSGPTTVISAKQLAP